ncbi:MAG: glycosyltransferase family 2 protein [bacterium]
MYNPAHTETADRERRGENPSPPLVSVVSLAYNRRENVLELVRALRGQDYVNFETIIVDNNSGDGTADTVESRYPDVRVLRCSHNFGMVSYNFGLEEARGEYILVIDDDGLPASSAWISRVVHRFESNPHLGAVACTVRMRDTGRVAYDSPQFLPSDHPKEGCQAASYNGTGAGLRAAALHEVGYYPFHFFRSWLELHLCTRLIEAGWEVRYFPSLEVWHSRPSGSTNRPVTYFGLRNYFWYVWTFYPWPVVLRETFRYLGYCLKLVAERELSVSLLAKAWFDSCIGWPGVSSKRQPVSRETIAYLHRVRGCENRHGLVPEYRPYVPVSGGLACY